MALKRSSHGNAYFTGFAKANASFFDTLLKQPEPGEPRPCWRIELGHFKHKHVLKRIVLDLCRQHRPLYGYLAQLMLQAMVFQQGWA